MLSNGSTNRFTMQKIIIALILVVSGFSVQSQSFIVAGKVIDAGSKQPLAGASVFCQNTTVGTVTKEGGEFKLSMASGGYDLVVSFTGFETQSLRISNTSFGVAALVIEMKPKEKNLEEISVAVSNEVKDGWDKYGSFFKENFIGKTKNSDQFTIQNPEAIHFYFSKKKNRLKILAKEDLVFINNALGYKIKYQLDSFTHEYSSGVTTYTGYPFFEELPGTDDQKLTWKKNREEAYYGSLLHFMRAYHDSSLYRVGFKMEWVENNSQQGKSISNPFDTAHYSRVEGNDIELNYPGQLRVVYMKKKPEPLYLQTNGLSPNTTVQISVLDMQEPIVIEENGYYYDQQDILNLGYWGWQKMADFLPYDYYPG